MVACAGTLSGGGKYILFFLIIVYTIKSFFKEQFKEGGYGNEASIQE
jgi:hypothetical protein